jgi:hypothetical protein
MVGRQSAAENDGFEMLYKAARQLNAAEKSGDQRKLKEMDFGVAPVVSNNDHFLVRNLICIKRACFSCNFKCMRCQKPCLDLATGKWKVRVSRAILSRMFTETRIDALAYEMWHVLLYSSNIEVLIET